MYNKKRHILHGDAAGLAVVDDGYYDHDDGTDDVFDARKFY